MKSELRKHYKIIRGSVTDKLSKEKAITAAFLEGDEYKCAETLFVYSAHGSEVSTKEIADAARADGKRLAYPLCTDSDGNMQFYLVSSDSLLNEGMYGIKEPDTEVCELIFPDEKSVMLVPALAFDKKGFRLGYGKGYYDRYISDHKCITVGLAFDECIRDSLPTDGYDKNVDILISDKKKYKFHDYQGG